MGVQGVGVCLRDLASMQRWSVVLVLLQLKTSAARLLETRAPRTAILTGDEFLKLAPIAKLQNEWSRVESIRKIHQALQKQRFRNPLNPKAGLASSITVSQDFGTQSVAVSVLSKRSVFWSRCSAVCSIIWYSQSLADGLGTKTPKP